MKKVLKMQKKKTKEVIQFSKKVPKTRKVPNIEKM